MLVWVIFGSYPEKAYLCLTQSAISSPTEVNGSTDST